MTFVINNLTCIYVHLPLCQALPFFLQLSSVNYSNSLVSKLNESQDTFSPSYETAQFGPLLERLNR